MAMKTKILTLCTLLALAAAPAAAQGIYEAIVATENSIVRVWQERDVVIYNEESTGVGSFLLYTVGTSTAQHIDLPTDISVRDFEVMGDDVWFCGEKTDNSYPGGRAAVVGTFNIPNTFGGATPINYAVTNVSLSSYGYIVYVLGLERLDLFTVGSDLVMAMTGEALLDNDFVKRRSTVVSAVFYPGVPTWEFRVLYDKDSTAIFTDIAALDNVVTAVGTSVDGTGLIAKSFYKSISFPNSPTTPNYGDSIVCSSPIGKALITHLSDDEAAVVQLDEKGYTLLHMLDFATGSAVPTNLTRITDDPNYPYDPEWDLKEIRYSPTTENISVLEYGVLPGSNAFETLLWTFPRWAWGPAVPVQPMTIVKQESMDVDIDSRPVTVGMMIGSGKLDVQSYAVYTGYDSPPMAPLMEWDNCTDYEEINYSGELPTVPRISVNDDGPTRTFNNQEHQPEVSEIKLTNICRK